MRVDYVSQLLCDRVLIIGLTCTEQNFITKSGFQQFAAKHGVIVVAPDTSPRTLNIETVLLHTVLLTRVIVL